MAIEFTNSSNGTNTGTGDLTVAHTITGSNNILFVSASVSVPSSVSISGITYNGVAMTKIDSVAIQANIEQSLWYLIGPTSGTNNIVVTSTGHNGSTVKRIAAASYSGVKQSGVPDSSAKTGPSTSATITQSTTTVADNCWVVCSGYGNTAVGASTGVTSRNSSGSVLLVGDSNAAKYPAGSYSMSITNSSSDNGGLIMASFAPASTTSIKTVNGLAIASVKTKNGLAIASVKTINGLA